MACTKAMKDSEKLMEHEDGVLECDPHTTRIDDDINMIKGILEEYERAGLIERNGEMRWFDLCREWQPVYTITELGRAVTQAGMSLRDYLKECN